MELQTRIQEIDKLEETERELGKQLFEEFTTPLKITEFKSRDWNNYGKCSLFALVGPVLFPYHLILGHEDESLAALCAPLLLPRLVTELFVPTTFVKKAKKVESIEEVLYTENRGNDPAALFSYDQNPENFKELEIIFPNGYALKELFFGNFYRKDGIRMYNNAKLFFHPNEELNQKVNDLTQVYDLKSNLYRELYQELKEQEKVDCSNGQKKGGIDRSHIEIGRKIQELRNGNKF